VIYRVCLVCALISKGLCGMKQASTGEQRAACTAIETSRVAVVSCQAGRTMAGKDRQRTGSWCSPRVKKATKTCHWSSHWGRTGDAVPFRFSSLRYPCLFENRARIINNPSARLAAGGTKPDFTRRSWAFRHLFHDRTESKNSKNHGGTSLRARSVEPKAVN